MIIWETTCVPTLEPQASGLASSRSKRKKFGIYWRSSKCSCYYIFFFLFVMQTGSSDHNCFTSADLNVLLKIILMNRYYYLVMTALTLLTNSSCLCLVWWKFSASTKQKGKLIYEQDLLSQQQICIMRNILNLMKGESPTKAAMRCD